MANREARRRENANARRLKKRQVVIDLRTATLGTFISTPGADPRCYAHPLRGCSGDLSREHPISQSILELIGGISTKGIPWLAHIDKVLPPNALAAKTLCKAHNNFLSPLDEMAKTAFLEFRNYAVDQARRVIIPGDDFERFMLKMLFGLLSTEKFEFEGQTNTPRDLGDRWLRVLFGLESMPKGLGLFVLYKTGQTIDLQQRITAAPIYLNSKICGLQLDFAGVRFGLTLLPKEQAFNTAHPDTSWILMPPNAFNKAPFPQEILFDWVPSRKTPQILGHESTQDGF